MEPFEGVQESASLIQEEPTTEDIDWDKGLPSDVLALVAKAGGNSDMKVMRGISKTWQQGFELAVTGITLDYEYPFIPPEEEPAPGWFGPSCQPRRPKGASANPLFLTAVRFPRLTRLALGKCAADEAWLETLRAFPNLKSLDLGLGRDTSVVFFRQYFTFRLTDTGLRHLRGLPLTNLGLSFCDQLTPHGLECLHGMPLTSIDLRHWSTLIGDVGIGALRGMPISDLFIMAGLTFTKPPIAALTAAGMGAIAGMPLTTLTMVESNLTSPVNLEALRGLPLTYLNLYGSDWLTDEVLDHLRGLPLTYLNLGGCPEVFDAGLLALQDMPLTSLELMSCFQLTDAALENLKGSPLKYLGLRDCREMSVAGIDHLGKMPLTHLDLGSNMWLTDSGLEKLQKLTGLSLSQLDLYDCKKLSIATRMRIMGLRRA